MNGIYEFMGYRPVLAESAYVHPTASIIGDVFIGENVYIGPGASLRGDMGRIIIKNGCNIQDNCTIHMFPGVTVVLEENSHIGHGAIVHGAHLGRDCLVGMNAVLMDDVVLGSGCIVGAGSFVKAKTVVPDRKLIVGNPAIIRRDVTGEMLEWKKEGTILYQELAKESMKSVQECEPIYGSDFKKEMERRAINFGDYKAFK
jgi:phenylacetic acid degradation protein